MNEIELADRVRLSCTVCGTEWDNVAASVGHTCTATPAQLVKFAETHRCESMISKYSESIRVNGSHPTSVAKVVEYRAKLADLINSFTMAEMEMYGTFRRTR